MLNPFTIYNLAFGYKAVPFPHGQARDADPFTTTGERLSKLGAVITRRDKNGTEAFCPVTIRHQGRSWTLPHSTIAMTARKRIIETPLVNRRGTVKELIQIEDYEFQIRGIVLTDDPDEEGLPQDAIEELRQLFETNEPVELENAFSEIFLQADNRVVLTDIDLPSMRGISGAQAYSIRVLSDTILELEDL